MRGSCFSCSHFYEVEELAGYNVRSGRIVLAVCAHCAVYYGHHNREEGWFEKLVSRIRMLQKRAANTDYAQRSKGQQGRLC